MNGHQLSNGGVNQTQLSAAVLRDLAVRQQQQIESQQDLLASKEARLQQLRQMGQQRIQQQQQMLESQEVKLRRLRAIRGQVEQHQTRNVGLTTELESVRALFNEKEKELSVAVQRVEQLTMQLEDVRSGRSINGSGDIISTDGLLERLRNEPLFQDRLTDLEYIGGCEEALRACRGEIVDCDARIAQLNERLRRKRHHNRELRERQSIRTEKSKAEAALNAGTAARSLSSFIVGSGGGNNNNNNNGLGSASTAATPSGGGGDGCDDPFIIKHPQQYRTLPYNTKFKGGVSENRLRGVPQPPKVQAVVQPLPRCAPASDGSNTPTTECVVSQQKQLPSPQNATTPSPLHDKGGDNKRLSKPSLPPKPATLIGRPVQPPSLPLGNNSNAQQSLHSPAISGTASEDQVDRSIVTKCADVKSSINERSKNEANAFDNGGSNNNNNNAASSLIGELSGGESHLITNEAAIHYRDHHQVMQSLEMLVLDDAQPPSSSITSDDSSPLGGVPPLGALLHQRSDGDGDSSASDSISHKDHDKTRTPSGESLTKTDIPVRASKSNLKSSNSSNNNNKAKLTRRVSFDPLALLLDAALEGELDLIKKTVKQVSNPSAANDEGITALHNAICANHLDVVKFLVTFGCDVNAQDGDGWTPLHCAASCNNLPMVKFLVEHGACVFAATLSDQETAAEKCEEDEDGYDGCSQYLYSIQEKLGIVHGGVVYAVFSYEGQQSDELTFGVNEPLTVIRKGDETEREWWWCARNSDRKCGYVPRNLLGLYPRIKARNTE